MAVLIVGLAGPKALFIAYEQISPPPFGMRWPNFLQLSGASQMLPGEMERLFSAAFDIVPSHSLPPYRDNTCLTLTRKAE